MKIGSTIALFIIVTMVACNQKTNREAILQTRIDSLERKLSKSYKPGFGEFMYGIQVHHAKLWFAGQNENWRLADFEIHEIMELTEDIQKYQAERKESKMISMLNPALDSVNAAIGQKNLSNFKSSYLALTNTCNNCHKAVNYEFNVVKIPDSPPLSNQVFKIQENSKK
jgi:hypothetical protein